MNGLLVSALVLSVLLPNAHTADSTFMWCYHNSSCSYPTWPTFAAPFCNGTRQSPIDIDLTNVTTNSNLTAFTLTGYDRNDALTTVENTGRTIKVTLNPGLTVAGGGLGATYNSLQFHLHWGNGIMQNGSEHTVNGRRYPMELHIVSARSDFGGNTSQAVQDSSGLSALGFFIDVMDGNATESPESWKNLTNLLSRIELSGTNVTITDPITINSLLNGTSLTDYYRYNGSLTTPDCNEAVVWTVFNETIKVSKDLIDKFSTIMRIGTTNDSLLMTNVYRGIQTRLQVQRSGAGPSASAACTLTLLSLMASLLLLRRD